MGYAQGMNDLLALFLVVTDSEVDSYWMFAHYMVNKRLDFMESSMMRKVGESTHTHTLAHTHTHTHTHSHAHKRTHTHSHAHSHTHTHTHAHTLTHTLTRTQTHSHTLTRTLTHTHSHTRTHTHTHTHTHTNALTHISPLLSLLTALVKKLISEIDEDLFQFFEASECHDYLFCHRWLLLDFKSEFVFQDSLRIFEVGKDSGIAVPVYELNHSLLPPLPPSLPPPPSLSLPPSTSLPPSPQVLGTHYLELYSDKAQVETDQ